MTDYRERLEVITRFLFGEQRGVIRSWSEISYARSVLNRGLAK